MPRTSALPSGAFSARLASLGLGHAHTAAQATWFGSYRRVLGPSAGVGGVGIKLVGCGPDGNRNVDRPTPLDRSASPASPCPPPASPPGLPGNSSDHRG